jgi:putative ABC transport system ATP-binding protein
VTPPSTELRTGFIVVENLVKVYCLGEVAVEALHGVSLTIEQGEFVAIMGASGAGKSTLMNILGCLDRPTSGRYLLAGREVSSLSADELAELRSTKIGFVFQSFNLLPRTSALENVELPLFYSAVPFKLQRDKALAALAAVGLAGRGQHHPSQLSGGEQQRVAIARALVNDPVLLLADEPTGNLDSETSREIMATLTYLNRERGLTVILITHELDIARFAGRRVVFKDGRIVEDSATAPAQAAVRER